MNSKSTRIGPRSVLVIDDEDLVRDMLRRALESAGIEVVVAADGREGLKAYLANPTDVVVTDILMPEKEGIETIIELKREHPNVKIVAISGGDPAGNTDFLRWRACSAPTVSCKNRFVPRNSWRRSKTCLPPVRALSV